MNWLRIGRLMGIRNPLSRHRRDVAQIQTDSASYSLKISEQMPIPEPNLRKGGTYED